ncbi:MAG: FAD:protein FMN transferase [Candidatus Abawacabacteria bacterium]|nr:FAD:protein FMN transferase [Candidatus Abawacabacteria bacterium]
MWTFTALGTRWQIECYQSLKSITEEQLLQKVKRRVRLFEDTYSRFKSESLIGKMAQRSGRFVLGEDAKVLFDLYQALYQHTDGAFTPLIGEALVSAGYDQDYSLQPTQMYPVRLWQDVIDYQFPEVTITVPVQLDFGAAGKGYLVDIVAKVIEEAGIASFFIDAGGDIYYRNMNGVSLSIGLEHPQNSTQAIGVVPILNQSICGSAGNRRTWGNWHHIINPHTLASPEHILATWVIADKTIIADALATCLFFVPPEKLVESYQFDYLIMYADHTIKKSTQFGAEVFIQN